MTAVEPVVAGRIARRRRERTAVLVFGGAVLVVAALSLAVGAYTLAPGDLIATLLGRGAPRDQFIVLQLRLPRVLLAIVVGAAFALAGTLFQTVLRNPLASPDIIGISQGASVAAVFAALVLGLSGFAVSALACVGALAAAGVIALLSWRSGTAGYRFVLVGVALAFAGQAVIGYLITRSDVRDAQAALVWLVGSLNGTRWVDVGVAAAAVGALVPLLAIAASRLRILQLGDETASGLGVRVNRSRLLVLALAAALAAVATAAVGPIAFVAFVAGPLARRALRTGGIALLPSALVGVLLVLGADFVAQHLLPGEVQVPVGILTGLIGAPYLLWLLARTRGGMDA